MCLLAILYRSVDGAPLLVAANREEFYDRPFLPPHVQGERPRFLAGLDVRAGGTWIGVNERGVLAAVTNRPKTDIPEVPRSRGQLCRDLLLRLTAADGASHLRQELATGHYAGANFVVADAQSGFLFEAGNELRESALTPGLHLVTNGPANCQTDPRQQLAREMFAAEHPHDVRSFIHLASRVCGRGPDDQGRTIVVRFPQRGTVSSLLLAMTDDSQQAVCEYAGGPPDVTPYQDLSPLLRKLLAGE